MPTVKYIHEGRFGPPKTWKTGAVLNTYPTPIGYFGYDRGGHEITTRPFEVFSAAEFMSALDGKGDKKFIPEVNVCDLAFHATLDLEPTYAPAKDADVFEKTIKIINKLRVMKQLPFKTLVWDPVTELSNAIWRHQAVNNQAALADARKWAGNIGLKVQQVIDFVNGFDCNTVFIFHTEVNKDELTQKTTEQPMVFSNFRNVVGGKFSQFFYQEMIGRDVKVRHKPTGIVNGIGTRWPFHATETTGPTFEDIYGKEPNVYK
jgi:hypothetical protein